LLEGSMPLKLSMPSGLLGAAPETDRERRIGCLRAPAGAELARWGPPEAVGLCCAGWAKPVLRADAGAERPQKQKRASLVPAAAVIPALQAMLFTAAVQDLSPPFAWRVCACVSMRVATAPCGRQPRINPSALHARVCRGKSWGLARARHCMCVWDVVHGRTGGDGGRGDALVTGKMGILCGPTEAEAHGQGTRAGQG